MAKKAKRDGRRGLEVELGPQDLVALTGAVVAPVGRAYSG
jgi:prolyl-tRNA editing enzyme YbaK/EbsC (Cys-tRNA(Pro) deacylase)